MIFRSMCFAASHHIGCYPHSSTWEPLLSLFFSTSSLNSLRIYRYRYQAYAIMNGYRYQLNATMKHLALHLRDLVWYLLGYRNETLNIAQVPAHRKGADGSHK